MPAMTPRKPNTNDRLHPADWTIYFEWDFTKGRKPLTVESRVHDVKVGQSWYQFSRHVVTAKGAEWLDCFELYPLGGFKAFRPVEVTAVRIHTEPKTKKPAA
jgi:hypothetical protein